MKKIDSFFAPAPKADHVQQQLAAADASYQRPPAKRSSFKDKPHYLWDTAKREECGRLYQKSGYAACKLVYGSETPPDSTCSSWAKSLADTGKIGRLGRPGLLTKGEEDSLQTYIRDTRGEGAAVDREALILLGKTVMSASRSAALPEELPELTDKWAKNTASRLNMTFRQKDSDRPANTVADKLVDNAWRQEFAAVCGDPVSFGIKLPEGAPVPIPCKLQLGLDETPLHYFPEALGTYEFAGVKNVHISLMGKKEQVTATPVTNAEEVVVVQVIWKGTTEGCHARVPEVVKPHISPKNFESHAVRKNQTHATFFELLDEINKRVRGVKVKLGVPADYPIVVVIDNVPSHIDKEEVEPVVGQKVCKHLYVARRSGIYLYHGLPWRSHELNSGDFLINKSLRDHIRRRTKLRVLHHAIAISEGKVAPGTQLNVTKAVMNPLLMFWLSEWLSSPSLPGWCSSSWKKSLQCVPAPTFVDDMPPPPDVIFLPAPPVVPDLEVASVAGGNTSVESMIMAEVVPKQPKWTPNVNKGGRPKKKKQFAASAPAKRPKVDDTPVDARPAVCTTGGEHTIGTGPFCWECGARVR